MIPSRLAVLFLAVAVLAAGCQKSDPPTTRTGGPPPPPDPPRKGRPGPETEVTSPAAAKTRVLLPEWSAFAERAKIPVDVVAAWTRARAFPTWYGFDPKHQDYRSNQDPAQLTDPVPGFDLTTDFRAGGLEQLPTPPVPFALSATDRANNDLKLRGVGRHQTLAALGLTGSGVTDKALEEVGTLPNLKTLVLSVTDVGDAGMKHVGRLTGLTVLAANTTKVTPAGVAHLKGLTNLTYLNLWGTRADPPTNVLTGFTRLRYLNVALKAAAADTLRALAANLKDLRELHLYVDRDDSRDGTLAGLKDLKSLERLYLNTFLSPGDVDHFRGLTGLKYLNLGGSYFAVNPAIGEAFKKALPNCEVVGPK